MLPGRLGVSSTYRPFSLPARGPAGCDPPHT
jgi:hypothetical protein